VPQLLLFGITGELIEFFVLGGYGFLSGSAGRLARQPRFARVTHRVSGTLLFAAGAGLALTSTE
jgi:threonine/homoserine/homoserine lactone efflux protein